ncbi:hypothetical protein KI387_008260, partial [Taxus chinensis]
SQRSAGDRTGLGFKDKTKGKGLMLEDIISSKEIEDLSTKEEKKEISLKDNMKIKSIG